MGFRRTRPPAAQSLQAFPNSWLRNDYRPDAINGILKCVERRIDLTGIKVDKAQTLRREKKFAATREFHQRRKFRRQMIGHADDLDLFVDQLSVREDRHRLCR